MRMLLAPLFLSLSVLPAGAQPFSNADRSLAKYSVAEATPAKSCERLSSFKSEGIVSISARVVAATPDTPQHCRVTGVITPVCNDTLSGRTLQWFQTYEYMRNFLSRYAWARQDGLLLISGAFAAYRRRAVLAVGGFDTGCLVEDYELTHRLRHYAEAQGMRWSTICSWSTIRTP